uniref:Uncharacterized protein n=1 Tax=Leptocylindrus danicus TaxID=163516 RepID=A0A7S2JX83_9STRA|mmetsp:Transcript_13596/g.20201  ORF Transcript_13596/g.20201 Transcript_13596/m.20201 type:complete len:103 (+) Transcript_13596:224-532(+)
MSSKKKVGHGSREHAAYVRYAIVSGEDTPEFKSKRLTIESACDSSLDECIQNEITEEFVREVFNQEDSLFTNMSRSATSKPQKRKKKNKGKNKSAKYTKNAK